MDKSKIWNKLLELEVATVMPTMDRKKELIKYLEVYIKNVKIPTTMVLVDGSLEKDRLSDFEIINLTTGPIKKIVILDQERGRGVGPARAKGVYWVMENTDIEYIFNTEDDSQIGEECIERLAAVQYQEPLFGYVGSVGNYTSFWRDFTKNSVVFYTNIGIAWMLTRNFIDKCGNFDTTLGLREDVELGVRAWKNGFYAAAIHAPVIHSRSNADFKAGDPPWMEAVFKIKEKFGDFIKTTKKGAISINRKVFQYPDVTYWVTDDLELIILSEEKKKQIEIEAELKEIKISKVKEFLSRSIFNCCNGPKSCENRIYNVRKKDCKSCFILAMDKFK